MVALEGCILGPVRWATEETFVEWWQDETLRHVQSSHMLPERAEQAGQHFQEWFCKDNSNHISYEIRTPNQQVIGLTNFRDIDWQNRSAEFTVFIGAKGYWNRGIGQTVARAMLKLAFEQYGFHRVMLRVYSHNERAMHVYKKIGFVEEGRMRHTLFRDGKWFDTVVMAVVDESSQDE